MRAVVGMAGHAAVAGLIAGVEICEGNDKGKLEGKDGHTQPGPDQIPEFSDYHGKHNTTGSKTRQFQKPEHQRLTRGGECSNKKGGLAAPEGGRLQLQEAPRTCIEASQ